MDYMIVVARDVMKKYDDRIVLSIPELTVEHGQIFGLVGNNGAGKTTFLRLVLDLIPANQGWFSINGTSVAKDENWKVITSSYLDDDFLVDFLTFAEFIRFVASAYNVNEESLSKRLFRLNQFLGEELALSQKKLIREMSQGNKQKAGIAAALIAEPKLLILDEPFSHLDPGAQMALKSILKYYNTHLQTTMIISSHNLNHMTEICSRIVLLEKGMIEMDIEPSHQALELLEKHFAILYDLDQIRDNVL
jgi:ABC-2 type transport system ATP-binding protein